MYDTVISPGCSYLRLLVGRSADGRVNRVSDNLKLPSSEGNVKGSMTIRWRKATSCGLLYLMRIRRVRVPGGIVLCLIHTSHYGQCDIERPWSSLSVGFR